jgi:diguanylate cyclase (GGDEF)-like protein
MIPTEFGRRLMQGGRRSDLFYRFGEQRFAALLDGTDVTNSTAFTKRIRQAVLMPFKFEGQVAEVDISMGVTGYPADGKTPENLMRLAEQLVLRAKQMHDGIATSQTPPAREPVRRRV